MKQMPDTLSLWHYCARLSEIACFSVAWTVNEPDNTGEGVYPWHLVTRGKNGLGWHTFTHVLSHSWPIAEYMGQLVTHSGVYGSVSDLIYENVSVFFLQLKRTNFWISKRLRKWVNSTHWLTMCYPLCNTHSVPSPV